MRLSHSAVVAALANQIIVIGDSQQMAPSSQFMRAGQSQVSPGMIRSLLDHAVASKMASRLLKQHYRSKHESLILFSKEHFYSEQLDIIPSPLRDGSIGALFKFVPDATYDRDGTGDNLAEAKALISDAIAIAQRNHFRRTTGLGGTPRSVGIITLNESQRDLILSLLPETLAENGLSELDLADARGREKLFVKSLENVQGDERDIILVSMTYGHDRKGRFIANLGMLSQPGAANRVNVLATRAKWKTVVYHSFNLDLVGNSSADGVRALTKYWSSLKKKDCVQPRLGSSPTAEARDALDDVFDLMQQTLRLDRYYVHRFPRFIAGFNKSGPERYTICFYVTDLYPPLQEASDIARIKGAGWQLCRIPLDHWRADPQKRVSGVYSVIANSDVAWISL